MDGTVDGKRLKQLTVIDEFTKQALPIGCRRLTERQRERVSHPRGTEDAQREGNEHPIYRAR